MNISVIIPVYNAERFLEKAVNSALQFEEVKEILLIEDCSPDNSLQICKNLVKKNSRVRLLQHPDQGNHGAGATRNLGLKKASQNFIAFLDADDYYLPNRFDAEKKLFQNPEIEGVFGGLGTHFITEKGKAEFAEKFKNITLTTVKYPAEGREVFLGLTGIREDFGLFFHLNTLTIRRENLMNSGLKFNEELKVHQDIDFIIKLSFYLHLKTGNITEAIAIRGLHDDNRITKIKQYSSAFYLNIFKLYQSLYGWSKNEAHVPSEVKKVIQLRYISFATANRKGFSKHFYFLINLLTHKDLLKTRYRFHAYKKHVE